jgi:hypothetical protein
LLSIASCSTVFAPSSLNDSSLGLGLGMKMSAED